MEKLFVANKSSYGAEFYNECNTLDELKRAIVYHELRWEKDYSPEMYTEELFKEHSIDYTLYEVDLHDDEEIVFHHVYANEEYHTDSWFTIEKKDKSRFSVCFKLKLDI
jgi:hypothetical protein